MKIISYFEHERELTLYERKQRRLWIATVTVLLAFLGTNAAHIILYLR